MNAAPLIVCVLLAAAPACAAAPPSPYIDKGACPFECCTYGDWTTKKPATLRDKPNGTRTIAEIPAGAVVNALTGEVISTPVLLTAAHDIPDSPILSGESFYVLHYAGEGTWSVWFKGRRLTVDLSDYRDDVGPMHNLHAAWWVNIRAPGGETGWVHDTGQFYDQGRC